MCYKGTFLFKKICNKHFFYIKKLIADADLFLFSVAIYFVSKVYVGNTKHFKMDEILSIKIF